MTLMKPVQAVQAFLLFPKNSGFFSRFVYFRSLNSSHMLLGFPLDEIICYYFNRILKTTFLSMNKL